MSITTYRGLVTDRFNGGKVIYVSRPCTDYYTAHSRAEKHAYGDRYNVDVATSGQHEWSNDAIIMR